MNAIARAEINEEVPVARIRSRPRGRETTRPNGGGVASEHLSKIMASAIAGAVVIVAVLTFTSIGHTIDLAVQHFMLFYAGVLTLIALCASVGAGLFSTARMFLQPGQRVMMQSIHRAISFGAFTFLIVHVVTEILAQRIDVVDVFIPFLQPFKTFYVGLGTIAGDIIILLVITGILRNRFVTYGKGTWRWRAIHYTNYVAFVFGVWHGLLAGRPGKPYVDWSYGFVVALVALGVVIRVLSNSRRPKQALSVPVTAGSATSGIALMLRAARLAQSSPVRRPAELVNSAPMLPADYPPDHVDARPAGPGHRETMVQAASPVYEPGYDGPPRYRGATRSATGPTRAVPSSTISGPLPQVRESAPSGEFVGLGSGPGPQAPGRPSGPYSRRPAPPMSPAGYGAASHGRGDGRR